MAHAAGPSISDLPLAVDDVTAEWLSESLSLRFPGTVVSKVVRSAAVAGFATKIRLELDYNAAGRAHGLPRSLWLKGGFSEENQRNIASYIAEARFYAYWGKDLPINLPRSYYEGVDRLDRQGLVLLEDLNVRGAQFGTAVKSLSPAQAAAVLELQAQYHARWWRAPELEGLRTYVDRFSSPDFIIRGFLEPSLWRRSVENTRGDHMPPELRDPAVALSAYEALWRIAEDGPMTFIHGDPHLENYFFETDGAPGAADWQAYVCGPAMHDVSYFLCGALDIEDRRQHEAPLIKGYLAHLTRAGVADAPTFEAAWEAHRRFALHGLCRVASNREQQDEGGIVAYAHRYGAACADLQTAQALGVA